MIAPFQFKCYLELYSISSRIPTKSDKKSENNEIEHRKTAVLRLYLRDHNLKHPWKKAYAFKMIR